MSVVLLVILQEYVYVNVPPLATPLIIVVNRVEPSYTLIDWMLLLFFVALIVNLMLDTVVPLSYTVVFGEIEKETVGFWYGKSIDSNTSFVVLFFTDDPLLRPPTVTAVKSVLSNTSELPLPPP